MFMPATVNGAGNSVLLYRRGLLQCPTGRQANIIDARRREAVKNGTLLSARVVGARGSRFFWCAVEGVIRWEWFQGLEKLEHVKAIILGE